MSCKTTANGRLWRRLATCAATVVGAIGPASVARADPLRLRADALAETQGTPAPAGLIVLQGEDARRPWIAAETLVWAGAGYLVTDVWVGGTQVVEHGLCTTVDSDRARAEVGQRARRLLAS